MVAADLDSSDNLFMVVENKLFTANRPGQLVDYLHTIEERYESAHCREYVFLMLDGREPEHYEDQSADMYRRWV